jgi:hypothetical protein
MYKIFVTIKSAEFKSKKVGESFGFLKYQSKTPFLIPVKIFLVIIDAIFSYTAYYNTNSEYVRPKSD